MPALPSRKMVPKPSCEQPMLRNIWQQKMPESQHSKSEIAQSRMVVRAAARRRPVEFAVGGADRQVVDRGVALAHQPALVEQPILVAIGAEPVAGIIVPLIGEAHG